MENQALKNYCIILAGGIGRRLWPASRKALPKQFIDFFGSGRTLLQQTYDRFTRFLPKEHILVSTYEDYVPLVKQQLPDLPPENLLSEPVQLNTAPAAIWCTWHTVLRNHNANILISPADQMIQDLDRFERQIRKGFLFVEQHPMFLALGVRPTFPNQAYGYIQMGEGVNGGGLYKVQSFSEKPEAFYAKKFLESGEFLWNTGIFLWNGQVLGDAIAQKRGRPSVSVDVLAKQMLTIAEEMDYIRASFPQGMPSSLDLFILENCENVAVQECDFGWADIGCWPELRQSGPKDADGNVVNPGPKVLLQGTQKCVVRLPEGMKAVIAGLDHYLVAQENGILMICPNTDPDYVRRLINEAQMNL